MSKQNISTMLSGSKMISAAELNKIAKFFNVSSDSLVQAQEGGGDSPIKVFMGEVKSVDGKSAIETAEKLMDLYSFHHKFQTQEYITRCNQVWCDE